MARRSDHSRDEIRQLALEAAEALIAAEGFRGLSARKVASAIGYTVGTLYLVFNNLDDLIMQLNGRTLDNLYDWLNEQRGDCADGQACLMALAEAYINYAEQQSPRWNLLVEYVSEGEGELPDWYQAKLGRVFGLVETALLACNGRHDPTTITQAARVLWAGVHGICTLKLRQRLDLAGGQTTEEMARMLIDTYLKGFAQ